MDKQVVQIISFNHTTRCYEGRAAGKRINWRNSSDRKWLMNHLHWAMHNNVEVRLLPESN